ncbi:FecR family protein [Filimonas lacunae]|uniref:FecR family protein n=1 Tax=Filimonas lacunae TaxID=477680 RepID=A0A173MCN7_9BACT|nr:FecR domain-containing protein [Filimonas lacunae]BAV05280.1 anti-sigma factor [Filimonas lacunae]SIT22228.1 FecR family protein [Filimonas lacunae]
MNKYIDNDKELARLLALFLQNKAHPEEIKEMLALIREAGGEDAWNHFLAGNAHLPHPEETPLLPVKTKLIHSAFFQIGMILILHVCFCFYLYRNVSISSSDKPAMTVVKKSKTDTYISLPDSSSIILEAGSTLAYPEEFSGRLREVELKGRAYFTISPNAASPFLIHAADGLTITVLGTRLDVKAYKGEKEITVTVQSGKVRVEGGQRVLGVLTANNQIKVNTNTYAFTTKVISANETIEWLGKDLLFRDKPLQSITDLFAKRFNVHFVFQPTELAHINVTSSFDGTESLKEIVDTLSEIISVSYSINGNEVVFTQL